MNSSQTDTVSTMQGHCLCGEVRLQAKVTTRVEACHCGMCRRWGGGPLMAVHCGADVQISGEDQVGVFASSAWAERAFCKCCGTHLYYHLTQANEYIVPVGLFQEAVDFELQGQIFIDKKPAFYAFANDTTTMTEAEVFAQYS